MISIYVFFALSHFYVIYCPLCANLSMNLFHVP